MKRFCFSPAFVLIFVALVVFILPVDAYADHSAPHTAEQLAQGAGDVVTGIVQCTLGPLDCLAGAAVWVVKLLVTLLANLILILVNLLRFVIGFLILGMGWFINGPASQGIQESWKIIRDMANIGIVGGLIATAVGTIIQSEKYNINATLARLIIAALLVNFSYFFAGAVIDVANVATITVYKSTIITSTCAPGACNTGAEFGKRLLDSLKLPRVSEWGGKAVYEDNSNTKIGSIVYNLLLAIFMLVFGFYLIQIIFLLLVRFVALIFLLITSPIGIAGLAIPVIKSYADEWWKALYTQALFPLVFFLLTAVALTLASNIQPAVLEQAGRTGSGALGNFVGYSISFMIAFAFLSIALRIAREISNRAEWFEGVYGWVGKNLATPVGRFYQTPVAAGFRQTIGKGAYDLGFRYKEWAARNRLDQGGILRGTPLAGIVAGADRQFQKTLGGVSKMGVLGREGYEPVRREQEKREIELGEEEKKEQQVGRMNGKLINDDKKLLKEYRDLKKKSDAGTLTDAEKERFASIRAQGEMLDRYEREGGAKTIADNARKRHEAEYKEGLRKEGESWEGYWKRQENRGELGRKKDEDLTAYFNRLDNMDEIGHYKARVDLESIFATLPADFMKEEYQKNPENILQYAEVLPPEEFMKVMKDPAVRRDLKDEMRRRRHGFYADRVRALDQKVQSGQVLRGSKEYDDELAQLFFYADKRLQNKDEFLDLVTSTPFEDLRTRETFWKGGSTTGQYRHVRPRLGTTEQYESYELKDGQLDVQRKWNGMQIMLGRETFDEKTGLPTDNPILRRVGGSDKYYAADESRAWAKKKLAEAEAFLKANTDAKGEPLDTSDEGREAIRKAKRLKQDTEYILAGPQALGDLNPHEAGISPEERTRRQNEINRRVVEARKEVEAIMSDPTLDAQQKDDLIAEKGIIHYAARGIIESEIEMTLHQKGKSIAELGDITKVETTHSAAFAHIGTFQTLAKVADSGGWDTRFKIDILDGALIEKDDAEIAAFAANDNMLQAFDGWPPAERLEKINIGRRIKYGYPPDQPSEVDLPADPKEYVRQQQANAERRRAATQTPEEEQGE